MSEILSNPNPHPLTEAELFGDSAANTTASTIETHTPPDLGEQSEVGIHYESGVLEGILIAVATLVVAFTIDDRRRR
jgi:hypothetical protein